MSRFQFCCDASRNVEGTPYFEEQYFMDLGSLENHLCRLSSDAVRLESFAQLASTHNAIYVCIVLRMKDLNLESSLQRYKISLHNDPLNHQVLSSITYSPDAWLCHKIYHEVPSPVVCIVLESFA